MKRPPRIRPVDAERALTSQTAKRRASRSSPALPTPRAVQDFSANPCRPAASCGLRSCAPAVLDKQLVQVAALGGDDDAIYASKRGAPQSRAPARQDSEGCGQSLRCEGGGFVRDCDCLLAGDAEVCALLIQPIPVRPEPDAVLASFARRGRGDMSVPRPPDVPPQVKKPRLLPGIRKVAMSGKKHRMIAVNPQNPQLAHELARPDR